MNISRFLRGSKTIQNHFSPLPSTVAGWVNVFLCRRISLDGSSLVGQFPCWTSSFLPVIDSLLWTSLSAPALPAWNPGAKQWRRCPALRRRRMADGAQAELQASEVHGGNALVERFAPAGGWEDLFTPARHLASRMQEMVVLGRLPEPKKWLTVAMRTRSQTEPHELAKGLQGSQRLVICLPHQSLQVICFDHGIMALAPHSQRSCSRWLVVDTDAGVDDAFALCMALRLAKQSDFEFKLITCCFGNCSVEQVGINVAKCLAACELPSSEWPKVVLGAAGPNGTQKAINASHFHGSDGLGDASDALPAAALPPPSPSSTSPNASPRAAADALLALLREAQMEEAEVTLVTLGPLTNLALALKAEPELPLLLNDLWVMGGCGNARGNHGRVTEFNIHADPEAASDVFARPWSQLTVTSWDLMTFATVPWRTFDATIQRATSQVGRFLAKISHLPYVQKRSTTSCSRGQEGCLAFMASSFLQLLAPLLQHLAPAPAGVGLWNLTSAPGAIVCDAITMAAVLRPELVLRSSQVHVEVELQGALTRGQTVIDWGTCFDGVHRPKHIRWVQEVDMNLFCRMLRETVS
ncbi:unnamed protein product [Cladocopium goreaui]|uniref:Arylsulfatase n=1 Tax=Cladocopium goreaui TaxID=2562237 RepID=A0A9P1CEV1_9DINO|nr:unnamed protein product [Cladocopium goreaui]